MQTSCRQFPEHPFYNPHRLVVTMSLVSRTPFQLTGRYAERNRWENLAGPGDSRPTGLQVVEDEGLLDGTWGADKVCLVTGVSSGAGAETVKALAATGATVYGTARDLAKARVALGPELLATGRVHVLLIDQADLASVSRCAAEFRERSDRLNMMVNNAAVRDPLPPLPFRRISSHEALLGPPIIT